MYIGKCLKTSSSQELLHQMGQYGASLGQRDSSVFKWSPWCHRWPHPRGL